MRTIVAGCRNITNYETVEAAIAASGFSSQITTIISGGECGVDSCGEWYATKNKIPLEIHQAEWDVHGRYAGPKRNKAMAKIADALIAVWDGESRGTANMINEAQLKGLKVYVHML